MCAPVCVYVCAFYFLHPTPPTISADHLNCCLLPASSLCQFLFFFFGSLPFQEAVKTVWISYVTARITVAPRYHVWSQLAQRLWLMWHRDSLLFFFLERMQLINCPHSIKRRPRFYCHSCSCRETELVKFSCCWHCIVMYCTFIVFYTAALASLRGL